MNKLTKIGISALAGSLAVASANAVEYTMSGGLMATYTTEKSPTKTTGGTGFGTATDLSFNASGELDNGFTVAYFMALDTDGAVSQTSSHMDLGMGSLGDIRLNNKFGGKANGIDDVTPNAYNETWDGLTGANNPSFFGSSTSKGSIEYRIPAQEYMGTTVNSSFTYDPNAGAGPATKGGTGANGTKGYAFTLQAAHESGIEVGAGIEEVEDTAGIEGNVTNRDNTQRVTGYIKYANGPVSVGYQQSEQNSRHGLSTEGADLTSNMASIAYTMGDLTVSYGESELETKGTSDTAALSTAQLDSIQAAYVMGAMTVSAAVSETDNVEGVAGNTYKENTLAVSFAF